MEGTEGEKQQIVIYTALEMQGVRVSKLVTESGNVKQQVFCRSIVTHEPVVQWGEGSALGEVV